MLHQGEMWDKPSDPEVHITYFNLHFSFWEQATISWFKLKKCGVFDSAFFFSTYCVRVNPGPVWIKGCNSQFGSGLMGSIASPFNLWGLPHSLPLWTYLQALIQKSSLGFAVIVVMIVEEYAADSQYSLPIGRVRLRGRCISRFRLEKWRKIIWLSDRTIMKLAVTPLE